MRIFHFYTSSDPMMAEYVETLVSALSGSVEMKAFSNFHELKHESHSSPPDIIHVHGCWRMEMRHILPLAHKCGARIVISPHGQLQPWVMKQHYKSDKLPKIHLFLRRLVSKGYVVIAMGRMEEEGLKRLWNPRIEIVKNPLVTESITKEGMAGQMLHIYNKVYDTAARHYMLPETVEALRALIKVGLTGDRRFIDDSHYHACLSLSDVEWRKILVDAYQESILGVVALGIKTMNLSFPDIDPTKVEYYKSPRAKTASDFNVDSNLDSSEQLASMITSARLLAARRRLTMSHIVKIADRLLHSTVDEERVRESAFRMRGEGFVERLMHILATETLLEEGYLVAEPKEDKKTSKILRNILKQNEL